MYQHIIFITDKLKGMNRCQHQEKITFFCITQSCISRDCCGCSTCINKYHNHISKPKIINQSEIGLLLNKLDLPPEVKPKSKSYRQALLHYISHIKTQINICLDHTLRVMLSQLNSPLIYQQGLQSTYKKILNYDYKKLNKKELIKFISFMQGQSQQKIIQKQRILYEEQAQKIFDAVSNLNSSMKQIKESVKDYFQDLDCGDIFYDKLVKLNKIRKQISPEKNKFRTQDKTNDHNPLKVQTTQTNNRKRKTSIDHTFDFQPIKHHLSQYDKNQKEIQHKMNKLIGLMNKKQINLSSSNCESKDKLEPKNPEAIGILSATVQKQGKPPNKMENSVQQNNPISIFSAYLQKGINIPEMVEKIVLGAHTIIPAPQNKQILYQEAQAVKKKTITVPMKAIEEEEQANSPILRKKKHAKNNFIMALKKIGQEQQSNQSNQELKQHTSLEKNQEKIEIADHQARSLALLMKSIHLSPKQAIPLLQKALVQSSDNLSAAQYLSYLYLQENQSKQCLDLCNETLQKIAHSGQYEQLSVHLINNKAAALNSLGRYSQSISILEALIKKNQKEIFYKNLGDAYFSIGIYQKSLSNYKRAIKMNPHFDQAYFNMSVCHFMLEHFNEAKVMLDQVLKIDSNNPQYVQFSQALTKKLKQCAIQ